LNERKKGGGAQQGSDPTMSRNPIFLGAAITVLASLAPVAPVLAQTPPRTRCAIDTHAHLDPMLILRPGMRQAGGDPARGLIARMDRYGIQTTILMPPPFPAARRRVHDARPLAAIAARRPGRIAFLGGGGTLNAMIDGARDAATVSPSLRRRFGATAQAILRAGARGFGEMTALHFSFHPRHPFEQTAPDHPLFLSLARIAARNRVPIDIHMEAVARPMRTPETLIRRSPRNPEMLRPNIAAFKRLLGHAPGATIIWAHAGWDNTGQRTPALMRRLMAAHPNLVMALKVARIDYMGRANRPLDQAGKLRPEWRALIAAFPDRFIIGSDQFHGIPGVSRRWPESFAPTLRLLRQLPPALARRIACRTPRRLFGLR
jgi:predicted TIM-barrel fold metal-dependent hydrolase